MRGYEPSSYGDGFADVYDDWYRGISDVEATVELIAGLCPGGTSGAGSVLELGVGTGRLALPLAERGLSVTGVDASDAMLRRLSEHDPDGHVTVVLGDMVDDLPDGPFDVVLAAYNTFFNLLTAERQQACFAAVATRLARGGTFVIEAFVPEPTDGSSVTVRSMTVDTVVLSASVHRAADQTAEGHFVEISESGGVRLRPWSIRYCSPAELDAMASAAGLQLAERWDDVDRRPFTEDSVRHVSTYVRTEPHAGPHTGPAGGQTRES